MAAALGVAKVIMDQKRFESSEQMLAYIKEHSDSVDQALVFISGYL